LAFEHVELVAQHKDLDLLGLVGAKHQDGEFEQSVQGPV